MTIDISKVVKIIIAGGVGILMGTSTYKKTSDAIDNCAETIKTIKQSKQN